MCTVHTINRLKEVPASKPVSHNTSMGSIRKANYRSLKAMYCTMEPEGARLTEGLFAFMEGADVI